MEKYYLLNILRRNISISSFNKISYTYNSFKSFFFGKKKLDGILILSFPKSGRTWLRTLIGKYYELEFGIEFSIELDKIEKNKGYQKFFFFHELNEYYFSKPKKNIFLIRDPKDVVVSYFHQITKREKKAIVIKKPIYSKNIANFIKDFDFGIPYITYYLNKLNVEIKKNRGMVLTYEALHKNTYEEVEKMFNFCNIRINKKNLKLAIEFSKFENMKKLEKNNSFKSKRFSTYKFEDNNFFKVRKGKIAGYTEELSLRDIKYVNTYLNKNLKLDYYKNEQKTSK
jgi:hypothetical protein